MSHNGLDPVIRALVDVPVNRLPLIKNVADQLSGSEGNIWHQMISQALQRGLPENIDIEGMELLGYKATLPELDECLAEECLGGEVFWHPSSESKLFPRKQPRVTVGECCVYQIRSKMTLREALQRMLGRIVPTNTTLTQVMKDAGQLLFLQQAGHIVSLFGTDASLPIPRTSGTTLFFPTLNCSGGLGALKLLFDSEVMKRGKFAASHEVLGADVLPGNLLVVGKSLGQ